jgi:hypothetical protein
LLGVIALAGTLVAVPSLYLARTRKRWIKTGRLS